MGIALDGMTRNIDKHRHHLLEVSGLQNFPFMSGVRIVLKRASRGQSLEEAEVAYAGDFWMDRPAGSGNSLLDLLDRGDRRPVREAADAAWAEKLSFGFYSDALHRLQEDLRARNVGPRSLIVQDARMTTGMFQRLYLEIRVSYALDALLPVRIESRIG